MKFDRRVEHGPTHSLYIRDPDGYSVELSYELPREVRQGDIEAIAAIASSFRNVPVDERSAVFGEVGLAGEVRATSQASVRVREAYAMGFRRCVIPHGNLSGLEYDDGIEVVGVRNVGDALEALF